MYELIIGLLAGMSIGFLIVYLVEDIRDARARKAQKKTHCWRCEAYGREHYGTGEGK